MAVYIKINNRSGSIITDLIVCGVLGGYIVFEKLLLLSVLFRSVPLLLYLHVVTVLATGAKVR